jgi:hypothetical protein
MLPYSFETVVMVHRNLVDALYINTISGGADTDIHHTLVVLYSHHDRQRFSGPQDCLVLIF